MEWYRKEIREILDELGTDGVQGLDLAEALSRLKKFGPNAIEDIGGRSPLLILWQQLSATMVLILIVAAVIAAILGDYKDAAAIGAIVVLFSLLGFMQEYRAERAMIALKKLAVPKVRVHRDGALQEISAIDLVPGDIIAVEAGNIVPADCRLMEAFNLRVQESALTGEAESVEKHVETQTAKDVPLADRDNMVFMGTVVTYGRGKAIVVETGMKTELGRIATMLQSVSHRKTPLQQRLDQLGKILAAVGVAIAGAVFGMGLLRGEPFDDMLLTAVSIAVAIVPEGLPAVVTITLALGAQRMLKRNALVRKLPAIETLGSVTVICTDKTGTLTENRMQVRVLDVADQRIELSETHTLASFPTSNERISPVVGAERRSVNLLLMGGALCNDARLRQANDSKHVEVIGDPTEGALLIAAAHAGLNGSNLHADFPRVGELPFDSERKRMTTVHRISADGFALEELLPAETLHLTSLPVPYVAFTKGAVDSLLEVSDQVLVNDRKEALSEEWRERILASNNQMARQGMRVLGLASKPLYDLQCGSSNGCEGKLEEDLIFIGLIGIIDPPRPGVAHAVQTCERAGIRTVMITGDHPLTAVRIAEEIGIEKGGRTLTGQDLGKMSIEDLEEVVQDVSIYARVAPEDKLKIVQALQNKGHIVAMTGDGVNDAPALKRADIGVAMGIAGTDVSKEASDMVLLDDNFSTIVSSVEEGRTIYDNLRKFIRFSIAGNIGKVSVMLLAPFLGKPLPLLPLQLLWLNLLTDGLLGLGLGVEPSERNVMHRPPHPPEAGVLSGKTGWHIAWLGTLIGAIAITVGYLYWAGGRESWQTMVFTTLAFSQIAQAFAVRSMHDSLFTIGFFSNKLLSGLALLTIMLQMAVIYVPFLQELFGTSSLSATDLGISIGLSSIVFMAADVEKWFIRNQAKKMDTKVGSISEGEPMSRTRSNGLNREEEEKTHNESRRRDPEGIEGLASMFLEEWMGGRGIGGSAHPLTGSDYVALLIENAFAPAELKLAKDPGGRDLLSRYAGELLQEMSERMIGAVEQTMNRRVTSTKSSAMVDADCVVSIFKLAGDKAHGKEN